MRLGAVWAIACCAMLLTVPAVQAETFEEEAAGQTFTVMVLEEDTTHNSFETSTSEFVYHQEDRTSGAYVNDQGAEVTATNYSRTFQYDDGTFQIDRQEEGAQVQVEGQAAGFTTSQRLQATYIQNDFFLSEDNQGETDHLVLGYRSNTYGNDAQIAGQGAGGAGTGDLVTPSMGEVRFVNGGLLASQTVRAGDTSAGVGGGGNHDTFAGDWTGSYVTVSAHEIHCQGFECQSTFVGESLCLLGYRPPFFLDCGL